MEDRPTKPKKDPRSLRNFLIEPLAQFRMGLRLVMINIAFLVAMSLVISSGYFAQYSILSSSGNVSGASEGYSPILELLLRHTIALSSIFVLFILLLMGAVIVYTHRIYGALVSIRRLVGDLTAGHYEKRCNLRANDELHDLAAQLNDLAKTLESKHGKH